MRLSALLAAAFATHAAADVALRGSETLHQVLVFDAGSSGTRIHVFNLLSSANNDRMHVPRVDLTVRSKQALKVKPGLSSFAERGDLEGTERNIRELLSFADQFVAKAKRASTPVMLKATAGLRAVTPEQASAVLERVRATLLASGYRFRKEWADIIQGKEEGGLAWVAANFLQGTFGTTAGGAQAQSVGVIEMGGGSTQVTFEIDTGDMVAVSDDFVFETALGRQYRLYAHSYLGYGQDHARDRLKALVPSGELYDPCYPHGYLRQGPAGSSSSIHGSGDFAHCKANIATNLMSSSDDAPGIYRDELPLKAGNFIATENFFYTQADLSLGLEGSALTSAALEAAAGTACSKTVQAEDKVAQACFALSFQAELLRALKASERGAAVKIAHQVGGGDVAWALGAALVHFLKGHSSSGGDSFDGTSFTSLLLAGLAMLLAGLGVVHVTGRTCTKQTFFEATGIPPYKIGVSTCPVE